jgi:hypothetical protein
MLRLVVDLLALHIVLGVLTGWLDRRKRDAVAYLIEENRLLRRLVVDVGCVSRTTIAVRWPPERREWSCGPAGDRHSRRRTRCCRGIAS